MTAPQLAVCVIIPVYRPAQGDLSWLSWRPPSTRVIALETIEDTAETWRPDNRFDVHIRISRREFNHGATRNVGAQLAVARGAQVLVFMTQDAVPAADGWLETLVAPILSGEVVATYARQLPQPGATPLEAFAREFNYPPASRTKSLQDLPELGVKAFFFSNVCSAVRADVFEQVGRFPENVIMNEDMTLAARILRAGHRIRYVAESQVFHSHHYTLLQQFRRNFDVGAFFADAGSDLAGAHVGGEGFRFVLRQLQAVAGRGHIALIPVVLAEAVAKYAGFQLGRHHHTLPLGIKRSMSMHRYHWHQERSK